MRILLISLICTYLACWDAHAQDKTSDGLMVWFTSHVCKDKLEPGTPGSTPELAIAIDDFGELYFDAADAKDRPEGEPAKVSKYECKWVALTGFPVWTDYYHYRANLYERGWETYKSPTVRYIVERFSDKSTRRADIVQRHVTLVGRFYDLCAAASRARQASDKDWLMVFGPCHYGENKGMMLTDVSVKQVLDDEPRYLLGDGNRGLINGLPPVDGADLAPLELRVRDWAASLKKGLSTYANETVADNPSFAKAKKDDIRAYKKRVVDVDGYAAYLFNKEAFRRIDPQSAPVAVFWDGPQQAGEKKDAWGCICLRAQCTDRWPLMSGDADKFLGDAACTRLTRPDDSARWYWD
jgi:hypothetical protein